MRTVKYTHRFEDHASSVIKEVYYDHKHLELYLVLRSGNVAGYTAVPLGIYEELEDSPSSGTYWNRYIKNFYRGISGDVEFVEAKPAVQPTENDFKPLGFVVSIDISGTLHINVPNANSLESAIQLAKAMFTQQPDAIIEVTGVKRAG